MDELKSYLLARVIDEKYQLLCKIIDTLEEMNYVDHEVLLFNTLEADGFLETHDVLARIDSVLLDACYNACTRYNLVVIPETTLSIYASLFELLEALENHIDHEALLSLVDEELDNQENFLAWVQYISPEKHDLIDDHLLTVGSTFIKNVIAKHEALSKVDVSIDKEAFNNGVKHLKTLIPHFDNELLATAAIKQSILNDVHPPHIMVAKFRAEFNKAYGRGHTACMMHLLSMACFSDTDNTWLDSALELINLTFSDYTIATPIIDELYHFTNKEAQLCIKTITL